MSEYRRKLMLAYTANKRSDDIIYPGLIAAWSAKGKTNDDADRATLRDLTGNGHDITLNGFLFALMSGYGGYNYSFFNFTDTLNPSIKKNSYIEINGYPKNRSVFEKNYGKDSAIPLVIPKLKIKVTIENNIGNASLKLYTKGGDAGTEKSINIIESGIYEIESYTINEITGPYGVYIGFIFNDENTTSLENPNYYCKIEQIPEYEDALVFDGIDDYGINENLSILEDYTFIYSAKAISENAYSKGIAFSKRYGSTFGEFTIGKKITGQNVFGVYSYGNSTSVTNYTNQIIYCTPTNFNGAQIQKGTQEGTNRITVGSLNGSDELSNMAFYSAYLFDKSLDEQEIKTFINTYIDSEYLLPSEQS